MRESRSGEHESREAARKEASIKAARKFFFFATSRLPFTLSFSLSLFLSFFLSRVRRFSALSSQAEKKSRKTSRSRVCPPGSRSPGYRFLTFSTCLILKAGKKREED